MQEMCQQPGKKRLSFRDPEVETSVPSLLRASSRPILKNNGGPLQLRGLPLNPSLEDLTLEKQAIKVVRTVGQAFEAGSKSKPSTPPVIRVNGGLLESSSLGLDVVAETTPSEVSVVKPLSLQHELEALRREVEVQRTTAEAAREESRLLRERLEAETKHNAQLLIYNRQLLDHVYRLVAQLQALEEHLPSSQLLAIQQQQEELTPDPS